MRAGGLKTIKSLLIAVGILIGNTTLLVNCNTPNSEDLNISAVEEAQKDYDENYLVYELEDSGLSYTVVGRGKCTKAKITIPATYQGKPVTSIGESALMRDEILTELAIPDSVVIIQSYAFNGCINLERVFVGDGVEKIEGNSFEDCLSLECVILGDAVNQISWHVFKNCTTLRSIVLGTAIRTIAYDWFFGCYNLKEIFYKGAEQQWRQIDNQSNSVVLQTATIYYYTPTEPSIEGNYWYLSNDMPQKW